MSKKNKIFTAVVRVIFVILIAVCLGTLITDRFKPARPLQVPHESFELKDWTWIRSDGTREQVTLPVSLGTPKGEAVTLETVIPDNVTGDTWVAVYNSRDLRVYIDGELRKTFSADSADVVGGIVKGIWIYTRLNHDDAGRTITIVRDSSETFNGTFSTLYYGDSLGIVSYHLQTNAIYYFGVILLAALSVLVVIAGTVLRLLFKRRIPIISLGIGMFFASLWLIYDSRIYQIVFSDYFIDGILAYMSILLVPYPIIGYIDELQKARYGIITKTMQTLSLIEACVLIALHVTGTASFEQTMGITVGVLCVMTAGILCTIITDILKGHFKEYSAISVGAIIFIACSAIELICLAAIDDRLDGVWLLCGLYALLITGFGQQVREINESDRARRQALAANAQKTTFLANMSHEIRTPINSIIGMNEMILRENKDAEVREYALQVESSGKLLLGLINDILDFSKIEAGKMEILSVPYDTATVLNDIFVILSERAGGKSLNTEFVIDPKLPSQLIGDEVHIKQILINLISNAVKYTKEGRITLKADATPSIRDNYIDVKFMVQDTGMGIRSDNLDKLFDTFTRVDEKKNRSIEGTGLGLSIVKRLVDEMQGTISVSSEYGVGSTFTVIIPQEIADASPIGNITEALKHVDRNKGAYVEKFHAPKARILIVDDNAVNLKVAQTLLKRTQVQIDTASGGRECINMCRNTRYDLIYMDHRMPDPDGIETLHLLRNDFEGLNNDTAVVVLTANAVAGLREKYIEEGFADYLSKPIDSALLEQCTMKYLPKQLVTTDFSGEQSVRTEISIPAVERITFAKSMRSVNGMDYDAAAGKYGGSEEFMRSLLKTVVHEGRSKSAMMKEYLSKGDYKDFGIEAHAAKSTMATICAPELSERAKALETAVKEGSTDRVDADAPAFIDDYINMIDRIDAAMKKADQ